MVRYRQNQIHGQNQIQNGQAMQAARVKRSALNALYVYIVSIVCLTPNLIICWYSSGSRQFKHAYFGSIQCFCIYSINEFLFKSTCLLLAISRDSRYHEKDSEEDI